MADREWRTYPNLTVGEITAADELLVERADGTGANITTGVLADWNATREGQGLSDAEDAWVKANVAKTITQWLTALPRWQDAHPDDIVGLTQRDGGRGTGIYELEPGSTRPKTAGFEVVVSFVSDGVGGLVWDATRGSISGKPTELRRITVDAAGLAMRMYIDTDVSQPRGPGNLTTEITAPGYSFNPKLIQQDFNVADDQEIEFLGTIATGLSAGEPVHINVLFGEENVRYFQRSEPVWVLRVGFGVGADGAPGAPGADGADGEDGFSPVFAVVSATASAESPTGDRRVLKVVDWLPSTGGTEPGYSIFRGDYDAGVSYDEGDIVASGGNYYISKSAANLGNAVTDTDHWGDITGGMGSGGGGGLTQAQVDARVRAGVQDFAEAGNNDVVPDAKLPATAKRTDAQVDARADARVQAGVADFAEQGNTDLVPDAKLPASAKRTDAQLQTLADGRVADWAQQVGRSGRAPKAALPSDTVYDADLRTDAQVDARADARIAPFARANNPSGTIADARIPAAITRDTEVAGRLLPAVTTSDADKIAKVDAAGSWVLADDEQGSGGGGAGASIREVTATADVTARVPSSGPFGSYVTFASVTIAASEAGPVQLFASMGKPATEQNDLGVRIRVTRVRGAATTTFTVDDLLLISRSPREIPGAASPGIVVDNTTPPVRFMLMDDAESGDVYNFQLAFNDPGAGLDDPLDVTFSMADQKLSLLALGSGGGSGGMPSGGSGLPTVSAADNGKKLIVVAGAWAAVDTKVDRAVSPTGDVNVANSAYDATSEGPTTMDTLASVTVSASEAGGLTIFGKMFGDVAASSGGGDRVFGILELVRQASGQTATTVLARQQVYIRNANNFGAANDMTQQYNGMVAYGVTAGSGDTLTLRFGHCSQVARTVRVDAADTEIRIWRT